MQREPVNLTTRVTRSNHLFLFLKTKRLKSEWKSQTYTYKKYII